MPKYRSYAFYRKQGYCGREEINLLVRACRSRLSVFVFLVTSYFSFLLFYFISFSMITSGLWFFLEILITVIFPIPPPVHSKGSFI